MFRFCRNCLFGPLVVVLFSSQILAAQSPSPNTDIVKMIQAGLPEPSVVAKIHEGAGHWDTSVDALIALKQAGATSAEIQALTDSLAAPLPSTTPAPPTATMLYGGVLMRTPAGDPFLEFPSHVVTYFADGEHSNRAMIISYLGKPAIRIPTQYSAEWDFASGNLIITHETLFYNPYLWEPTHAIRPKNGQYEFKKKYAEEAEKDAAFSMPLNAVRVGEKCNGPDCRIQFGRPAHDGYFLGWHSHMRGTGSSAISDTGFAKYISPELEKFFRDLVQNFDGTMGPLLQAAGISDADKQLSKDAHYQLITADDFPRYAAIYQDVLNRTPPEEQPSGAGLAALAQILTAGSTALQQSSAGGNTPQAQEAAMAQYYSTVNGVPTTAAPYVPPVAPTAPAAAGAAVPSKTAASAGFGNVRKVYREPMPSGGIRQDTITGNNSSGFTDTFECFAPGANLPYQSGSASGPTEFIQNVPHCNPLPSSAAAAPTPSPTVGPPVAYQKPPESGAGTIVAGTRCPASGYIFTSYGDAATGVPCTPGQPVGATQGGSGGTASGSGPGTSGDFVTGLDRCVSESFTLLNPGDTVPFLTFTDGCSQPIRLLWILGPNGTPRGHTFATGEIFNQTGSDQNDVHNQGGVTFYACPTDHPVAVDTNGNQILTPVTPYKCARHS